MRSYPSPLKDSVLSVCGQLRGHQEVPRVYTLECIERVQEVLVSIYESYNAPAPNITPDVTQAMRDALTLYSQSLTTLGELLDENCDLDGEEEALSTVEALAIEAESLLGQALQLAERVEPDICEGVLA